MNGKEVDMGKYHPLGTLGQPAPMISVPSQRMTTGSSALLPAFRVEILIIGVNPYVSVPDRTLRAVFGQAGKDKGPIPVHGTLDGHAFIQTLVRFSGAWRLYINGPMLKAAKKKVGDKVSLRIAFDPRDRSVAMHPALAEALRKSAKADATFQGLPPSRRKEIMRYIAQLKSEASVSKNVARAIAFLEGKQRFAGRERP